jgi:hypothetical protein
VHNKNKGKAGGGGVNGNAGGHVRNESGGGSQSGEYGFSFSYSILDVFFFSVVVGALVFMLPHVSPPSPLLPVCFFIFLDLIRSVSFFFFCEIL